MKNFKSIIDKLKNKADYIAIRYFEEKINYYSVKDNQIDDTSIGFDKGVMIEVLVDGQFAYAATNSLNENDIHNAAEEAIERANKSSKWKICNFDANLREKNINHSDDNKNNFELRSKDIFESLFAASKIMGKVENIVNNSAMIMNVFTKVHIVSSNDCDIEQNFNQIYYNISATAKVDDEIQTRSDYKVLQTDYNSIKNDIISNAKRVAEEAVELANAEECPTGLYDLVLAPDQLYLQIHESIGHPLELDRILGDERNYAGSSFVKQADFGSLQYGSDLLNIVFAPNELGELASYKFDDTGNKATKEYIIKDGKLERALGSSESQFRSNILGVANSRACSWNRPPIDRMANINLEPGDSSFVDIISGITKGIIMYNNKSWSIDDYRNKFQFGCEYAKLIENGKITKTVKNPNYRGQTEKFWHNLAKVGDKSTYELWGAYNCGKGEPNQAVRVGHATPVCLFRDVEIFGGA